MAMYTEECDERAQEIAQSFSYDGYQIVRREMFAHLREPAMTIRRDSLTFNTACIEGLEETDFFDGLHCAGTGIARFFPGVPQALQQLETGTLPDPLAVHPRTSLESADPNVVETPDGETAETAQEG